MRSCRCIPHAASATCLLGTLPKTLLVTFSLTPLRNPHSKPSLAEAHCFRAACSLEVASAPADLLLGACKVHHISALSFRPTSMIYMQWMYRSIDRCIYLPIHLTIPKAINGLSWNIYTLFIFSNFDLIRDTVRTQVENLNPKP